MKLTEQEFKNKVFVFFEDINLDNYFNYQYETLLYLQQKYLKKYKILVPIRNIGDEIMEKLNIDRKKWNKITSEIHKKERQKFLKKVEMELDYFVLSLRVMDFELDFQVGELVEQQAERIVDYHLSL